MNMNAKKSIYMIGLGSKNLSVRSRNVDYVIGFNKVMMARAVHYYLPPYPELSLVRGEDINLSDRLENIGLHNSRLVIDPAVTLFIPKTKGTIWHPLNEFGQFLDVKNELEFMTYPMTKGVGIIIPQEIKDETEDEFVIRSFLIEPMSLSYGN
jgi:hypothetical protein